MPDSHNILLTNSSDIYGGGEFYVLELAKALIARAHSITVACKPGNLLFQKCVGEKIPAIPLDFPPQGKLYKFTRRLGKIIKERRIRIVHTNSNYDRTAGAFAARLAGIAHVTNVHSFHSLRHNVTHWLRNSLATDHYIVDGLCVKKLLVDTDRIPSSKISVVYLGVNPEDMKNERSLGQTVRTSFGIDENRVVIGNVGRLVPFKGQEYLLKGFAEILPRFPVAMLLLVGDGELSVTLSNLARDLGIEDNVVFAGFRDDLRAVYSAFDIYAHPSVEGGGETFPFAVLQALAQELPVVVTRVGDVAEMVVEGVNGYVVQDRDPSAIAGKLSILLGDAKLRRSMSVKSREYLLKRFTTVLMVNAIEKIYDSILVKNIG